MVLTNYSEDEIRKLALKILKIVLTKAFYKKL